MYIAGYPIDKLFVKKIPLELNFSKPGYTQLKDFGCIAYATNVAPTKDKFVAHANNKLAFLAS